MFSLSRAGLAGFAVGSAVMVLLSWVSGRIRLMIGNTLTLGLAAGAIALLYEAVIRIIGWDVVSWHYSVNWLVQTGSSRIDTYASLMDWLTRNAPFGAGQGLVIFTKGGIAGFARLLIEGGWIGAIFLLQLHFSTLLALWYIWQHQAGKAIAPFIGAAYASSFVTTLNYINTTDIWIWFFWALPVITWQGLARSKTVLEEDKLQESAGIGEWSWFPYQKPV